MLRAGRFSPITKGEVHGFFFTGPRLPSHSGVVGHQIKVGTLDSSPLPVPPHLTRLRVGSVNRLDFFGWSHDGIVRMVGRTVPSGTVIDSESRTVDPERLRQVPLFARPDYPEDHSISFGAEYRIDSGVAELAQKMGCRRAARMGTD